MYQLKCITCSKSFESSWNHAVTCSVECRKEKDLVRSGRKGYENISSGTAGAITEMLIASDLMKNEFSVFRALSPACFCDLIAVKNGKIFRVEVKTAYRSKNGNIGTSPTVSSNYDVLGLYIRQEDRIFYRNNEKQDMDITKLV